MKCNYDGGDEMQNTNGFSTMFLQITDEKEKAIFLNNMISFLLETNLNTATDILKLTEERNKLKEKVNRAQGLIDEAQAEVAKVKKATTNEMKRKLQITRDRLVAISSTVHIIGSQINEAKSAEITIDTLNNIIASIGIVTDELVSLGLWDTDEVKPELRSINLLKATTKKVTRKKPTKE